MTAGIMARMAAWILVAAFLFDLLRRCWIVEAWTIVPFSVLALLFALARLRKAWRSSRCRKHIGFIRPAAGNFPAGPKRPIR